MLVGDFAHDLLDQILDRQQPVDAAILVHHQRQVHTRLTHLQQQVEHRYLRRHHQRVTQQAFQLKRFGPADIGIDVLDVDHADDLIQLLAIDRQAAMALAPDVLQRLVQRHIHRHGDDIGAWDHDVVGRLTPQTQHVGDQRALLPVQLRRHASLVVRVGRLLH